MQYVYVLSFIGCNVSIILCNLQFCSKSWPEHSKCFEWSCKVGKQTSPYTIYYQEQDLEISWRAYSVITEQAGQTVDKTCAPWSIWKPKYSIELISVWMDSWYISEVGAVSDKTSLLKQKPRNNLLEWLKTIIILDFRIFVTYKVISIGKIQTQMQSLKNDSCIKY